MPISLRDVHISGTKVGIKAVGPVHIEAQNVTFDNVETPWDVQGAVRASVQGTRIRNDPKVRSVSTNRVGWTPQGPALPACCGQCGTVFPSRNYGFRTPRFYGRDNEDTCPICFNEHAKISEGLFDLTGEAVALIAAIAATPDRMVPLQTVSSQVLSGNISPTVGLQKLGEQDQRIAQLADKAAAHGFNAAWFVGVFVAVAISWFFYTISSEAGSSKLEVQKAHKVCLSTTNEAQRIQVEERKKQGLQQNSGVETKGEATAKPSRDDGRLKGPPKGDRL